MAPGGVPGGARLLCLGALVLVWAVPVDPQWRVFRAASSVLAPSYSRDITVPVGELRYPGASRKAPRSSPASGQEQQQQPPRSRRQYKSSNSYSKQSTFSLLRRLISETANETRTAFNQIGDILGSQFSDSQSRTTTARTTTTSTTTSSSLSSDAGSTSSSTPSTTTTTTEAPYRISRQELFGILQRNSIGIGRLFRREYDSAMQDSKVNLNRFKQEFRMAVAPFLQAATTEASSTTAASRRRR
ncbi:uncharacterized protein LOC113207209 [Frankliniella occidentalis]|uniref:Uncharacterized protein LOC113207209 n=1 Tax=Frankliniella occidentalis TaxID=133901 RepID=A0A9C6UBJ9_FRAOC|nr:uncharacterized protein LOC113207209 [Frankliniella occidentalis]XP_052124769.1 uncharacterized protein LOC113207209 [Frankliniella occidentalis]XP_052124770.1 uncharacterized protein LOC113207209 [Frankliniella occidentalis]